MTFVFKKSDNDDIPNSALQALKLEGVLYTLTVIPLLICSWSYGLSSLLHMPWIAVIFSLSAISILAGIIYCPTSPGLAKLFAFSGFFLSASACLPKILTSPMGTLLTVVGLSFFVYFVSENMPKARNVYRSIKQMERILFRARSAAIAAIPFLVITFVFYRGHYMLVPSTAAVCGLIAGTLGILWSIRDSHRIRAWLNILFFLLVLIVVISGFVHNEHLIGFSILWPVGCLVFLPQSLTSKTEDTSWIEPLLGHPARLLVSTFFGLITVGTLLLMLPAASASDKWIAPIDAAFTSVSAVCVTGLIVLDTPVDFSITGQFFILLLIQAGGLGIMAIATIALHAIGKRFSLRQERILATVNGNEHGQLYKSLRRVLVFTLLAESIGAIILTILFYLREDNILTALWRGVFTSISAFCNAGFALQSNSLMDYQQHPLILHIVAILIILGGLSPAVCAFIPDFIFGRRVSPPAFLVLVSSALLLLSGTVVIAAMEWNSTLSNLSYADKIHNAWFQSATLRTAGFNSIDISSISPPVYLIMLVFMFIGGSPGSTAGGIKTTTLAVFVLCMSSIVRGRPDIVVRNHKIEFETVYKSIAVIGAGLLFLLISVMALELTQLIPVRDIVFEAFSALGTVGLSTGATQRLDEIGKVIIILTMFLGRIGPLTMFMVLSSPVLRKNAQYPSVKIPIT